MIMKKKLFLFLIMSMFATSWVSAAPLSGSAGDKYNNITSATSTQIKTGNTNLSGIIINGGTMGTITIYNNTSCTGSDQQIVATRSAPYVGEIIPFDVFLATGLCIKTEAASNLTVFYK